MSHGCESGGCGCSTPAAPAGLSARQLSDYEALAAQAAHPGGFAEAATQAPISIARVNGAPLQREGEWLEEDALRQRACTELLRQAAQRAGLLAADDVAHADGTTSAAASEAIEQLLERELQVPDPSEEACRRHFEAHPAAHAPGERVQLRHVLFAVTPGVDVKALRQRAEALLIELRCADDGGAAFAQAASQWSNCPTGQQGGELGWISRSECVPEFARDVFGSAEVGVLARLVHSRFGLHIVEVVAREAGERPAFEQVRAAVALTLRQQTWVNALRQYLQLLAGSAELEGVALDAAESPLVQ